MKQSKAKPRSGDMNLAVDFSLRLSETCYA